MESEQEQLKKIDQLLKAVDKAYNSPKTLVWRGFMIGLASGLGATIGVALVLSVLGLVLRELGGLPVVGDWVNNINDSLPSN